MQRSGGTALVELAVPADRGIGRKALDRHAAPLELGDRAWVGTKPPICADTYDQSLRQEVEHLLQILEDQRVSLAPPPVGDDSIWQHDQITRLL